MLKIKFGTDGIRGDATSFPFFSPVPVFLGAAIGIWARKKDPDKEKYILLVRDTRISGKRIAEEVRDGLLMAGENLHFGGVAPTPAAFKIVEENDLYKIAIVVSASHNKYSDNGIKIFCRSTGKIEDEDKKKISEIFSKIAYLSGLDRKMLNDAVDIVAGQFGLEKKYGKLTGSFVEIRNRETTDSRVLDLYIDSVKKYFDEKFLRGRRIVLDCAHGATIRFAAKIFKKFGAELVEVASKPNGYNINRISGSTNCNFLSSSVITHNAEIGFAFDGDGDRLIAASADGTIFDGDEILARIYNAEKRPKGSLLVGTVMSSMALGEFVRASGGRFTRTMVGDHHVADKMMKSGAIVGGEPSGHVIIPDYLNSGDGIFAALLFSKIFFDPRNDRSPILKNKAFRKELSVKIPRKKTVNDEEISKMIIAAKNKTEKLLLRRGRIVLRKSGTEKVVRIMVEHEDSTVANFFANRLKLFFELQFM